ncbi:alpha-L-rhamnosidase-related protein [Paenibacillus roseipurpureus]|uniref:Trehalase family glycosidase n=1 Tax=Paenibacillus roseopurpureus TaxID=2918901 RepID=A0AA96LQP5_9BACL|nr:trehalase family glycosidase [Paenibacillus sp. MBLB1832]WNR46260.1 trehalase family glycosidase [Paenibacillus sp. MBLB1832]
MEWAAKWVWVPGLEEESNCYAEFRKVIEADSYEGSLLHISACQEYALYINGVLRGRGPSPCTPKYQYYDTYEIEDWLQPGRNVIGVVCYHFGEKDIVIEQMQGEAGFLLQLDIDRETVASTDESWLCRRSLRWAHINNRISRWSGFNEIYKVADEDGWEHDGYDDSGWSQSSVRASVSDPKSPWQHVIPREIPFLYSELSDPVSLVRVETNYGGISNPRMMLQSDQIRGRMEVVADRPGAMPAVVFDFEKEVVGRPLIRLQAPEGGTIRIAYGESLELQDVDTFILKKGLNVLQPFGRRACRYMKLTFMALPVPIQVASVQFDAGHYAFGPAGQLETTDVRLMQIWDISVVTTTQNSQEHLEDCPWREKALWVADAVVMGKVIYHVYGDTKLLRKCLLQGARIQNADGSIPGTGPESNSHLLPDFCAHWLLGVHDYFRYTGDVELLRELWGAVERLVSWFKLQEDAYGLFAGATRPGFFCFIDWTPHIDRRDKVTVISLLYVKALKAAAVMAEVLGHTDQSLNWQHQAEGIAAAVRKHLWLSDKGAYADCMDGAEVSSHLSLQTNFAAIWCDLMTKEEALSFIHTYYDGEKLPRITGAFFQHLVLEVLLSLGLQDRAMGLIRSFWGGMVDRGAKTWWETFDPESPSCTIPSTYQGNVPTYLWEGPLVSMCHGWGASPAYILGRMLHGVDISDLGTGKVRLLTPALQEGEASGVIPTKHGDIRIAWSALGEKVSGTVQIPKEFSWEKEAGYPEGIHIQSV